jgi:hypothetical protein
MTEASFTEADQSALDTVRLKMKTLYEIITDLQDKEWELLEKKGTSLSLSLAERIRLLKTGAIKAASGRSWQAEAIMLIREEKGLSLLQAKRVFDTNFNQ